jgi:hypothetical protein
MARDWIERQNAQLLAQGRVFSGLIASEPGVFQVAPAEAARLTADFEEFAAAHAAAIDPARRTKVVVFQHRLARKARVARMREIGGRVRANPDVPVTKKMALGLPVRRARDGGLLAPVETDDGAEKIPVRGSGRIGPPKTRPIVIPAAGGVRTAGGHAGGVEILFRLVDELRHERRTRPSWTLGAGVWFFIGRHAPLELQDWRFARLFTKTTGRITISPGTLSRFATAASGASPGETVALNVWLAACWLSPTGEAGPASKPVSVTVLGQADRAAGSAGSASDDATATSRVAA